MTTIRGADLEAIFVRTWGQTKDLRATLRAVRLAIQGDRIHREILPRSERREIQTASIVPILLRRFAAANDVTVRQIVGRYRRKTPSRVRWECMWTAYDVGKLSYSEVGEKFGGRSHSEAMRAVRIVRGRIAQEPGLAERLRAIGGVA